MSNNPFEVKSIQYKGKTYVEVAERVRQVHLQNIEFEVLSSDFQQIIGRVICRVQIRVGGKIFVGNAEAKIENAQPKSADATNPFECAETSALGRALAFAGFGTVDSIASFDEIARSVPSDQSSTQQQKQQQQESKAQNITLADLKTRLAESNLVDAEGAYIDLKGLLAIAYKKRIAAGKVNLEVIHKNPERIDQEGLNYLSSVIAKLVEQEVR